MNFIKRAVAAIFDFLQSIVVVMAIMVMIYLYGVSPQEIKGASMEPSFFNAEYILTNKVVYKLKDPVRGDVVIFKAPKNPEIDYIKRVIGLPGDTVGLRNNAMYVNGIVIDEPYLSPGITIFGGSFLAENQEIVVPQGKYFVLGDNRPHSADSREFGPIPKVDFIGKAFLRYWPFTRFGLIPPVSYRFL